MGYGYDSDKTPVRTSPGGVLKWIALVVAGITLLTVLVIGVLFGVKTFARYQARADARNQVTVTAIQIKNYEQKVKVAQQQANIRYIDSTGVRRAQDEIAKTLTPLYVQFEMIDALKAIATSGSNNSVVYIPSGANGVPLIAPAGGPAVQQPAGR